MHTPKIEGKEQRRMGAEEKEQSVMKHKVKRGKIEDED
jgi:hypothetical protein